MSENKNCFTYDQAVHLNSELREQELPYRIDYRDENILGIEPLGLCACIGREDALRDTVNRFFETEEQEIFYSADGMRIYAKKPEEPL